MYLNLSDRALDFLDSLPYSDQIGIVGRLRDWSHDRRDPIEMFMRPDYPYFDFVVLASVSMEIDRIQRNLIEDTKQLMSLAVKCCKEDKQAIIDKRLQLGDIVRAKKLLITNCDDVLPPNIYGYKENEHHVICRDGGFLLITDIDRDDGLIGVKRLIGDAKRVTDGELFLIRPVRVDKAARCTKCSWVNVRRYARHIGGCEICPRCSGELED